jgi:hypothetical protein
MADIFDDNPLAYDFILHNTTTNQQFNLTTGSQNIPAGATGTLRFFDVDFCEFKYKYKYQPPVKDWFDAGYITVVPVLGVAPIVCPWQPSTASSSGSGSSGQEHMVRVTSQDDAATYLNDAVVTQLPIVKSINSTTLVGGGLDQQLKLSLDLSALNQVGSFYFSDYAATTIDATPTVLGTESLTDGSYSWTIYLHATATAGPNIGKRAVLLRTVTAFSRAGSVQNIINDATSTNRQFPCTFLVTTTGANIEFKVQGTISDTIIWKASIIKNSLAI